MDNLLDDVPSRVFASYGMRRGFHHCGVVRSSRSSGQHGDLFCGPTQRTLQPRTFPRFRMSRLFENSSPRRKRSRASQEKFAAREKPTEVIQDAVLSTRAS